MPTESVQFPASRVPVQTVVQADPQQAPVSGGEPGKLLPDPSVRVSVEALKRLIAQDKGL